MQISTQTFQLTKTRVKMHQTLIENLKEVDIIIDSVCSVVFSFHIIILLMWVVVLFNTSIRLRRKVKYSLLANYNQDTCLEALNSKVEYRKSLFMFAIVLCELISSILTVVKIIDIVMEYVLTNSDHSSNSTILTKLNKSSNSDVNGEFHRNICNISNRFGVDTNRFDRVISVCFGISLILTFSLVYTLMSYYVMVTKKSLNYNLSLKSVDLAREQKVLLLVSSVMCLILLVLLVRIEVYILYQIVESGFVIFQCYLTYKYSRKLVQVFKWKIQDTKIAFGTDNYKYKLYNKTLSTFQKFAFFYNLVVIFFSIHVLFRTVTISAMYLQPPDIHKLYNICINPLQSATYSKILEYTFDIMTQVQKIPLSISFLFLFLLNLSTVPFLLSKINLSCSYKRLNFTANKNMRRPLLK